MTPIVSLPGAAGRPDFWRPVAERLAGLGPAHLVGYPGFAGLPPDPALGSLDDLYRWVVARLPKDPFDVVAQSMGGVLAARRWPHARPEVIRGGDHGFGEGRADEVAALVRGFLG